MVYARIVGERGDGAASVHVVRLRGSSGFVSVGWSELGFEAGGGAIELRSEPFEVEGEDGARVFVPAGLPLRVAGLSARRTCEDYLDPEGFERTRHGLQLASGTLLYTDLTVLEELGKAPYRDAPTRRAARRPLILAASLEALDDTRRARPAGHRGALVFVATMAVLVLGALSAIWR